MKDEDITVTVAEPLLLGEDYFTLGGGNAPGSLAFVVSEHPLSVLPPPASPGVLVVDDVCSMVETPTRTYRLTDSEGQPPPLVPTVEAVKVWGEWWWGSDCGVSKIVRVEVDARGALRVWFPGWELEETVGASAPWLGPVTERPKERA